MKRSGVDLRLDICGPGFLRRSWACCGQAPGSSAGAVCEAIPGPDTGTMNQQQPHCLLSGWRTRGSLLVAMLCYAGTVLWLPERVRLGFLVS